MDPEEKNKTSPEVNEGDENTKPKIASDELIHFGDVFGPTEGGVQGDMDEKQEKPHAVSIKQPRIKSGVEQKTEEADKKSKTINKTPSSKGAGIPSTDKKGIESIKRAVGEKGTQTEELNKVNEAEFIIGLLFFLGADTVSLVLDFTDGGAILGPSVQNLSMAGAAFWFKFSKGSSEPVKLERMLIKVLANWIPFIPTLAFIWIIECYLHNHPKLKKAVSISQKVVPGKK